jgi:hypothetical protein
MDSGSKSTGATQAPRLGQEELVDLAREEKNATLSELKYRKGVLDKEVGELRRRLTLCKRLEVEIEEMRAETVDILQKAKDSGAAHARKLHKLSSGMNKSVSGLEKSFRTALSELEEYAADGGAEKLHMSKMMRQELAMQSLGMTVVASDMQESKNTTQRMRADAQAAALTSRSLIHELTNCQRKRRQGMVRAQRARHSLESAQLSMSQFKAELKSGSQSTNTSLSAVLDSRRKLLVTVHQLRDRWRKREAALLDTRASFSPSSVAKLLRKWEEEDRVDSLDEIAAAAHTPGIQKLLDWAKWTPSLTLMALKRQTINESALSYSQSLAGSRAVQGKDSSDSPPAGYKGQLSTSAVINQAPKAS